MLRICENGYTRITKVMARKLHARGKNVYIIPCNMRLFNPWQNYGIIPKLDNFDTFVRDFEIYNCRGREAGEYAAFYTDIEEK